MSQTLQDRRTHLLGAEIMFGGNLGYHAVVDFADKLVLEFRVNDHPSVQRLRIQKQRRYIPDSSNFVQYQKTEVYHIDELKTAFHFLNEDIIDGAYTMNKEGKLLFPHRDYRFLMGIQSSLHAPSYQEEINSLFLPFSSKQPLDGFIKEITREYPVDLHFNRTYLRRNKMAHFLPENVFKN